MFKFSGSEDFEGWLKLRFPKVFSSDKDTNKDIYGNLW